MNKDTKSTCTNPPLPLAGEGRGEGDWCSKRRSLASKAQGLRKTLRMRKTCFGKKSAIARFVILNLKDNFPVGPYIADFLCIEGMLIIEVDGGQHCEDEKDKIRTAYLKRKEDTKLSDFGIMK